MIWRIMAIVLTIVGIHSAKGRAQASPSNIDSFKPGVIAQTLENGFRSGDKKPLAEFLEGWHHELEPVADDALRKKPDFERAVYALFVNFYSTTKWAGKGRYRVVQDSVNVTMVDGDLSVLFAALAGKARVEHNVKMISEITIHAFRPAMNEGSEKILYFDRRHLDVLLRFLTGKDKDLSDTYATEPNGIGPDVRRYDVREARLSYLDDEIEVLPNMSGKGWRFTSHVSVSQIYLSVGLESAIVTYTDGYSGNIALLRKGSAGWQVAKREEIYIE